MLKLRSPKFHSTAFNTNKKKKKQKQTLHNFSTLTNKKHTSFTCEKIHRSVPHTSIPLREKRY